MYIPSIRGCRVVFNTKDQYSHILYQQYNTALVKDATSENCKFCVKIDRPESAVFG